MLEPASVRRGKPRKPREARTLPAPTVIYTPQEFCDAHRISRSRLYELWQTGQGPKYIQKGVHKLITVEAAAEWRQQAKTA